MLLILSLPAIENISSEAENSFFCDQLSLWPIPNPLYPIKLFFNLILVKKERKLLEQISRSHTCSTLRVTHLKQWEFFF